MLTLIYATFAIILSLAVISVVYWTYRTGISPMPSTPKAKAAILKLIKENVPAKLDGDILELGSGFLTLALPVAKLFPKNNVIAYEKSTIPYLISTLIKYISGSSNLTLLNQDFFKADFNNASLIICYLYPSAMEKLNSKFKQELKASTFIISNTFAIPNRTPYKTIILKDLYHTKIYLYKI